MSNKIKYLFILKLCRDSLHYFLLTFLLKKNIYKYSKRYILNKPLSIEKPLSTVFLGGLKKFELVWVNHVPFRIAFFDGLLCIFNFYITALTYNPAMHKIIQHPMQMVSVSGLVFLIQFNKYLRNIYTMDIITELYYYVLW